MDVLTLKMMFRNETGFVYIKERAVKLSPPSNLEMYV